MGITIHRSPDLIEQRRRDRTPIDLEIALRESGRRPRPGRLVDITAQGCRIGDAAIKASGGKLWIKLPTLPRRLARVVWTCGDSLGIEFVEPLGPSEAAAFVAAERSVWTLAIASASGEARLAGGTGTTDPLAAQLRAMLQGLAANDNAMALAIDDVPAGILNLSASAVRVRARIDRAVGASVALAFGHHPPISGRVVWVRDEEAGIALPPGAIQLHGD